jgi:hypothetical protein
MVNYLLLEYNFFLKKHINIEIIQLINKYSKFTAAHSIQRAKFFPGAHLARCYSELVVHFNVVQRQKIQKYVFFQNFQKSLIFLIVYLARCISFIGKRYGFGVHLNVAKR